MMKKTYKLGHLRGFTLIELLVVIAIIGILASVVLASLNTARDKGADAAAKSNLNNARAEAELYYDNATPDSYEAVCNTTGTAVIGDNVTAAASALGGTHDTGDTKVGPTASTAVCHDSATGWAAAAPLKAGGGWCVDSTGFAGAISLNALTNADVTCN